MTIKVSSSWWRNIEPVALLIVFVWLHSGRGVHPAHARDGLQLAFTSVIVAAVLIAGLT